MGSANLLGWELANGQIYRYLGLHTHLACDQIEGMSHN